MVSAFPIEVHVALTYISVMFVVVGRVRLASNRGVPGYPIVERCDAGLCLVTPALFALFIPPPPPPSLTHLLDLSQGTGRDTSSFTLAGRCVAVSGSSAALERVVT